MTSSEERERESEARLLYRRRLMYLMVLLLAAGVGTWFVRWLSQDLGVNRIGEHYHQADKFDEP